MVIPITSQLILMEYLMHDQENQQTLSRAERRAAILDAAASVFFERGFAATSIDAVIERSGGSKRNIYDEFGNKQGLLIALITETADKALAVLTVDHSRTPNLHDTLLEFAQRLFTNYMSPPLLGIFRIILAESSRFPELAKAFHEKGPGRAVKRLAELLEDASNRGEIETVNFKVAADQFLGLLRGNLHLEVMLGLRPLPDKAEAEMFVRSAVDMFVKGLRVENRN